MSKIIWVLFFASVLGLNVTAQQRTPKKKPNPKPSESKPLRPYSGTRSTYDVPSDLVFGEASVSVKSSSLTHKVAIAPNGVVIVEFPAEDAVYSVHPGNQALVELDGLTAREADRRPLPTDPLVFRPGAEFSATSSSGKTAATLYTVQFVSGLVVTLKFYPVNDLDLNTNRLVLSYSVGEIQKARTSAGLAANMVKRPQPKVLDEPVKGTPTPANATPATPASAPSVQANNVTPPKDAPEDNPISGGPQVTSTVPLTPAGIGSVPSRMPETPAIIPVSLKTPPPIAEPVVNPQSKPPAPADVSDSGGGSPEVKPLPSPVAVSTSPDPKPISPAASVVETREVSSGFLTTTGPISPKLNDTLTELMGEFKKRDPRTIRFLPARQGLALAFTSCVGSGSFPETLYTIAVRNDSGEPLILLPDQPDAFIVTKSKDAVVNTERIEILARLTDLQGNRLAPGQIALFVVAINRPPMGIAQHLEVTFTQNNAADDPAAVNVKR